MKRVTRDIEPAAAHDLLERVPRACIGFASADGPQAQPVVLIWREGRFVVGLPTDAAALPGAGEEVVLLVDEGVYFFDLRAIYVRGELQPAAGPDGAPAGYTWMTLLPSKQVAWDYGMLREVDDADQAG